MDHPLCQGASEYGSLWSDARHGAPRDPSIGLAVPILQMRTMGRRWAPGHRLERKRLRPLCTSLPLGGLEGWGCCAPNCRAPRQSQAHTRAGAGRGPQGAGGGCCLPSRTPRPAAAPGRTSAGCDLAESGHRTAGSTCLPWSLVSTPCSLSLDKEASVGPHAPQESPAPPEDALEFSKSPFGNSANRKAQPLPAATWPSTKVPEPSGCPLWLAELQDKLDFNEGKSPSPGKSVAAGKWFSTVLAPPSKEMPLGTKTVKMASAAIWNPLKSQELNHFYFQT